MPSPQSITEHRLQELEVQSSYQQASIDALEKTVALQHQELQLLNKKLHLLSDYIKNLNKDSGIKHASEETPPPHY